MPDLPIEDKAVRLANVKVAKELWPYIRPYIWMLCLSTFLVFIVTGIELLLPIFIQKAFDGFIVPGTPEKGTHLFGYFIPSFTLFCLVFAGFISAAFIIDFFQTLFMEYTGQKIILNLRCQLFSHMSLLPVSFFDKNSSGRLVSRVAGDVENMNEMFTSILIFIFKDLVLMTAILVILFNLHFKLGLYLSFFVPVIVICILLFSRILRNAFRTIRQKIAEINHSFSEAISGIKIIQTNASEQRFQDRFTHLNFAHFTATLFQIKIFSIFMPFIGFLGVLSVAIIIGAGSFEVVKTTLTIGELVAFLTYMKLFFRPLRELSEKFNLLQNALASAERIIAVLNEDPAEQRTSKNRAPIKNILDMTFKNVNFSYEPGKTVLKNIHFHLKKGRSIGIVGRTGSGKSSIINLISGFYTPGSGKICFNGIEKSRINTEDIRKNTALVMQDPILFSGTVKENIAPADRSRTDMDLDLALKKANCDFLYDKFSGLKTRIHEGGRPLSSGEKQLVCIARAFAFNPDLIIFDEATSYMDSRSEQKVHDAMRKLMKGRMSIIIAHRLSTVRNCDSILLIRDGKIRERGSHQTLITHKGEYYNLLMKEKI